jgi:hypothetical protein
MKKLLVFLLSLCAAAEAGEFKAGLARQRITPPLPFWVNGYAARTNPVPDVKSDIYARALALEDDAGGRAVIVGIEVLGLSRDIADAVAVRVKQQYNLDRERLLMNCSHTHAAPVIWRNTPGMAEFDDEHALKIYEYGQQLVSDVTAVVGAALANLAPATLTVGHDTAGFAINRRAPVKGAGVSLGVNPTGPTDHDVPVVKITGPDGGLRGVLFGYACHNTTMGGNFYAVDGDYAGCAMRTLEQAHPGATALFLILCGGDQNPSPRGKYEHVEQHGRALAQAVEHALAGDLKAVRPPLRAAFTRAELEFAPHTRQTFEDESKSTNPYKARRARLMLAAYDQGREARRLGNPVQALRLGDGFTILALGGEVVVDYALRVKREFAGQDLMVAGYSNEVPCYIASARVLREGGYEALDSMIYYGQPGPFTPEVEEQMFRAIRSVMGK